MSESESRLRRCEPDEAQCALATEWLQLDDPRGGAGYASATFSDDSPSAPRLRGSAQRRGPGLQGRAQLEPRRARRRARSGQPNHPLRAGRGGTATSWTARRIRSAEPSTASCSQRDRDELEGAQDLVSRTIHGELFAAGRRRAGRRAGSGQPNHPLRTVRSGGADAGRRRVGGPAVFRRRERAGPADPLGALRAAGGRRKAARRAVCGEKLHEAAPFREPHLELFRPILAVAAKAPRACTRRLPRGRCRPVRAGSRCRSGSGCWSRTS